eukprot:NODE_347_length_967_cov_79.717865_g302_i0.p1 GENE.NODE_347_length_967_cov_79.717865_g302_i0~~NODE_347_length_967_cov_79.717865_g302_i0.p1  ORF type:complete len:131 (+),score=25.75 NODE_347_length_967_cov_79.717865_g302_i0:89-481(+)
MSASAVLEQLWTTLDSGNSDALEMLFSEGVKLHYPGEGSTLCGRYEGRSGARCLFEKLFGGITRSKTEVELVEKGNLVVNLITEHAKGNHDGAEEYDLTWVANFTVENKKISHVEIFVDTQKMARLFPSS